MTQSPLLIVGAGVICVASLVLMNFAARVAEREGHGEMLPVWGILVPPLLMLLAFAMIASAATK